MYWDTHMHCYFSSDATDNPEDMVLSAIDKGLNGICFTDHMDYDFPVENMFIFNVDKYFEELYKLQKKYKEIIKINIGVEIGLQSHLKDRYEKLLTSYKFDQVIASSHLVNGYDVFDPVFFKDKSEYEAYEEYFLSILENVKIFDNFDVYGHLDYVVRYGPNKNENYSYNQYKDIIDEILKMLIEKGKGIELNMAGFKYGLNSPNPTIDILKKYKEFGGEILTIGSDAHKSEHIAYEFKKIKEILEVAGFSHYTVFKDRQASFYKV